MAVVSTPVEGFNGHVAGVDFVGGKGETDNEHALTYFRRHGYEVTEAKRARTKASAD